MEKFLQNTDTLHRWLCDMIDRTPQGRAEYGSFTKSLFSDDEYPRFIELMDTLKAEGKVGYRNDKTSLWIVIHQRHPEG